MANKDHLITKIRFINFFKLYFNKFYNFKSMSQKYILIVKHIKKLLRSLFFTQIYKSKM